MSPNDPRSLLVRPTISAELTPHELYRLIETLSADAICAAACPNQIGYADYLFQRIAQLRETCR
jgi:hypothetical protein